MHQHPDAPPAASEFHVPSCESESVSRRAPDPSQLGQEDTQSQSDEVGPRRVTERRTSPTRSSRSSYGGVRKPGAGYVSSAHWTALLDGIAGLREHLDEGEAETQSSVHSPAFTINAECEAQQQTPLLFYFGGHLHPASTSSKSSIIGCIPSRTVVDRLVTLYFNEVDVATGVIHRTKFLREYEKFWTCPDSVPISWLGILLALMCLSSQFQKTTIAPASTFRGSSASIDVWRNNVVQCLILGNYTKGGDHVMESLILYLILEMQCLHGDVDAGIWLLVGTIVNIAVHMGLHRDAGRFPEISPFDREMRRRTWAFIFQIDLGISTQVGKPRHIKQDQTDTEWPRNLMDSDFDEGSVELPPSRPETDVTPILYTLAKLRILSVGAKCADIASSTRPGSHAEALQIEKEVDLARSALPPSIKWPGSGSSLLLTMTPLSIINSIWLELGAQKLKMLMYQPFIAPATPHGNLDAHQLAHSRSVCLDAATSILDLHHFVDEETQPEGRLFRVRWRLSRAIKHEFLLATGVLCHYFHLHDGQHRNQRGGLVDADDVSVDVHRIRRLLRVSLAIWLRDSNVSRESRDAVTAIQFVLGDNGAGSEAPPLENTSLAVDYFPRSTAGPVRPTNLNSLVGIELPNWVPNYDFPYIGLDGVGFTLPGPRLSPNLGSIGGDILNGTNSWTQMGFGE